MEPQLGGVAEDHPLAPEPLRTNPREACGGAGTGDRNGTNPQKNQPQRGKPQPLTRRNNPTQEQPPSGLKPRPPPFGKERTMPKKDQSPARRATIRHFVAELRDGGLSPSMLEIEIGVAVERLREEHGILVSEEQIAEELVR